jgi:hypothetical protein
LGTLAGAYSSNREALMNRQLTPDELAKVVSIPIREERPAGMTKRQKLLRFAAVVRAGPDRTILDRLLFKGSDDVFFVLFDGLEFLTRFELDNLRHPRSPFAVAVADSVLHDAGLTDDSVGAAMRFFELSQDDVHAFSCGCGGKISSANMAARIEAIANRAP